MTVTLHPVLAAVTDRIRQRSAATRADLSRAPGGSAQQEARSAARWAARTSRTVSPPRRRRQDHAARRIRRPNIAIVSSYNDMLSAHQPFERFPAIIKRAAREAGAHRAVRRRRAGDVRRRHAGRAGHGAVAVQPRRDRAGHGGLAVAQHVRRRAVPGRLRQDRAGPADRRAAVRPPAGDLRARRTDAVGLSNDEKARVRQLYAKGEVGRDALLDSEAKSYHSPGTCTFYGTANSNQMLMEVMGLHLPGAAFVNPNTPLRDALTAAAADAGGRDQRARRRVHADRPRRRRARDRQRHRRPARHRRLDQPHDPPGRDRARRGHRASTGTTFATCPTSCRCSRASTRTARPT